MQCKGACALAAARWPSSASAARDLRDGGCRRDVAASAGDSRCAAAPDGTVGAQRAMPDVVEGSGAGRSRPDRLCRSSASLHPVRNRSSYARAQR